MIADLGNHPSEHAMAKSAWLRWTLFAALLAGAAYGLDATLPPQPRCVIPVGHEPIKLSADGSKLFTLCHENAPLREWDTRTGKMLRSFFATHKLKGQILYGFSSDATICAFTSRKSLLYFVDLATGREWCSSEPIPKDLSPGRCTFSTDNKFVLVNSVEMPIATDEECTIFDVVSAKSIDLPDQRFDLATFCQKHANRLIKGHSSKDEVEIWDLTTRRKIKTIGDTAEYSQISPDGRWLLTGKSTTKRDPDEDAPRPIHRIAVWNLESLELHCEIPVRWKGQYHRALFSKDGRWLAFHTLAGPKVEVWDVLSKRPLGEHFIKPEMYCAPVFAPDSSRLMFVDEGSGRCELVCVSLPDFEKQWQRSWHDTKDLRPSVEFSADSRFASVRMSLSPFDSKPYPFRVLDAVTGEIRMEREPDSRLDQSDHCWFEPQFAGTGNTLGLLSMGVAKRGPTPWYLKWFAQWRNDPEGFAAFVRYDRHDLESATITSSLSLGTMRSCQVSEDGRTLLATLREVDDLEQPIQVYDMPTKPPRVWVYGPPLALGVAVVLVAAWRRRKARTQNAAAT
jgi:WD40 repeat protein